MTHVIRIFLSTIFFTLLFPLPFAMFQGSGGQPWIAFSFKLLNIFFLVITILYATLPLKRMGLIGFIVSITLSSLHLIEAVRYWNHPGAIAVMTLALSFQGAWDVISIVLFFLVWKRELPSAPQWLQQSTLSLTVLLGMFVFIEWTCRVVVPPTWSEASHWRWYSQKVKRNAWGMRDSFDPLQSKKEGVKRVLILGDSFAFGYKVDENDTLGVRLQEALQDKGPVEVINASQVNWSISEQADFFRKAGWSLKPDLVVVVHVLNDISPVEGSKISAFRIWCYYNIYATNFFRPLWEKLGEGNFISMTEEAYQSSNPHWNTYFKTLAQLKHDVNVGGGKLMFVVFPWLVRLEDYPFSRVHSNIQHAVEAEQIPYFDLLPALQDTPTRNLIVSVTDFHPNALAHRKAAKALALFLDQ